MSDTCNQKIVTLESRNVELFNLEMAKLRILRKTQTEEQEARKAEEIRRKEEMERANLLNELKSAASRRAIEDNEEQQLQNRMKDCVQEMTDASSDSDLLKAMTKVLACYQSKSLIHSKLSRSLLF